MKRFLQSALMVVLTGACMSAAWAQQNGAPPGNKSPSDDGAGKSAGIAGGAGAAGQSGTDPATLKRTEEQRVKKQHGGASGPGTANRKDWKE
ncbi:hypothetical protein [Caballeronia sp. LZ034LL]|uniref:hypothetical protein n=1 Tax=Caballeronia sp. LZ034LL TaxID=3038567 RepID=UPI00285A36F8|nr:hypothetical protein [Caballeronia sp. LZ034LL]MDR5835519.1 hypothetical protein [Caballeronia sp. LZ034LL]